MKKNTRNIFIIFIVLLACCCFILFVGFGTLTYFGEKEANDSDNGVSELHFDDNEQITTEETLSFQHNIDSIYNNDIVEPQIRVIDLYELDFAQKTLEEAISKGWNGKDSFSVNESDFSENWLQTTAASERAKFSELTIPSDLQYLYTSYSSRDDIEAMILQAHDEYINYLKTKGVNQKVINELDNNVLPADIDRFKYVADTSPDIPTYVEGLRSESGTDYSKLMMYISAVDMNNGARLVKESNILGPQPSDPEKLKEYEQLAMEIGFRWYFYHEMTHALQKAYMNLHVEEEHVDSIVPYRDYDETLAIVDEALFWKWGEDSIYGSRSLGNNIILSGERQSEGISFEILINIYDMSPVQQEYLWKSLFGRLSRAQETLDSIHLTLESDYPKYEPQDLGNDLLEVSKSFTNNEYRNTFTKMALKINGISAYAGYMHPMKQGDIEPLWELLRQE